MKFSLTIHLNAGTLEIESEYLTDVARGYLMARDMATNGHLPAVWANSAYPITEPVSAPACDAGVVREASQEPIQPVADVVIEPVKAVAEDAPEPEVKTTRKRKEKPAPVVENVAPEVTEEAAPAQAAAAPTPEVVAESVPREVAQAKLGDLLRDKGAETVAALLKRFGVSRFGLYVAEDYAEFCAAIDEAAK